TLQLAVAVALQRGAEEASAGKAQHTQLERLLPAREVEVEAECAVGQRQGQVRADGDPLKAEDPEADRRQSGAEAHRHVQRRQVHVEAAGKEVLELFLEILDEAQGPEELDLPQVGREGRLDRGIRRVFGLEAELLEV